MRLDCILNRLHFRLSKTSKQTVLRRGRVKSYVDLYAWFAHQCVPGKYDNYAFMFCVKFAFYSTSLLILISVVCTEFVFN